MRVGLFRTAYSASNLHLTASFLPDHPSRCVHKRTYAKGVAIAKEAQNEGHRGLRATGISRSHVKRAVTQRGAPCVVSRTCDYLASNNDQVYVGGCARSTWGPTSGSERVHCS